MKGLRCRGCGATVLRRWPIPRARWPQTRETVFRHTATRAWKHTVPDPLSRGGGGEPDLRDGIGWTNGVSPALAAVIQPHAT